MSPKKSIIRKGPSAGKGRKDFVTIKEDEAAVIVPILSTSEILSLELHGFWNVTPAITFPCIANSDDACPGCEAGDKPGYRAYLPVLDETGEMKIFPFGISVERQLTTLEDELESIVGLKLKVRRTGAGLATKYQIINTGKTVDIEEFADDAEDFVMSKIDIKERADILVELRTAGLIDDVDEDEDEDEEVAPRKKASKRVVEVEDEEDTEPKRKPAAVRKGKAPAPKGKVAASKGKKVAEEDEDGEDW